MIMREQDLVEYYFEREKALDLEIETYSDILKSDTELDVNWVNSAYKSELDSSKVIEYEKWFKSLSQDIYLAEGWRVVNDIEES